MGDRTAESDLFQAAAEADGHIITPLAARVRPRTLDEFVGQAAILGPGTMLRKAIEADRVFSMILWGPPGCGKSSLAHVVAQRTAAKFERLSAVLAGVQDIRRVAEEAREAWAMHRRRTILFIDEIHRLNKAQQDAFLPHVEAGTFTLIGATTENPYFSIISPLISRCRVFKMAALTDGEVSGLVDAALTDGERGVASCRVRLTPEAKTHIVLASGGDARSALNAIEAAAVMVEPDASGERVVDLGTAEEAMQQQAVSYDRAGDEHYDTISAYIKSMRGGDPDAALYWLAKMLVAGEDPMFIARRLMIQAAEDVGNADPMALVVAVAAAQATQMVGMPEAQIPLAAATIYVATAPKSNASYTAIAAATEDVKSKPPAPVPPHLRRQWPAEQIPGQEAAYRYPHEYPGAVVPQDYLPSGFAHEPYYVPTDRGREAVIAERLARWEELKRRVAEEEKSRAQGK